jgi:5'-deoxynucleotidase YfbR-like HD superfamily hydrolase
MMFEIIEQPLRMRPTILTHSGNYFDFLNPQDSVILIGDIAWALSHICRFTGHVSERYSVGQHSLLVSSIVPPEDALAGLLHDAAEAYLGDVSSPLKQLLPEYQVLEERVEQAIFKTFGLPEKLPKSVKHADLVLLATEKRDLLPKHTETEWRLLDGIEPLSLRIQPYSPEIIRKEFLARFNDLYLESLPL